MLLIFGIILLIIVYYFYFKLFIAFLIGLWYGKYYFDQSEFDGRRTWREFKNFFLWKYVHEYFNLKIIYDNPESIFSSDDDDVSKNKKTLLKKGFSKEKPLGLAPLLAMHPHGCLTIGSWICLALHSELNKDSLIKCIVLAAANINFFFPGWREFALYAGVVRADEIVIKQKLVNENRPVLILPGGIREELLSQPNILEIYDKRKGFARVAYETKSPLIPIYARGEIKLFNALDILPTLRNISIDLTDYPCPTIIYSGPHRGPLHIIIGTPIDTKQYKTVNEVYKKFYRDWTELVLKYDHKEECDCKNFLQCEKICYEKKYGPNILKWRKKLLFINKKK